MDKPRYKYNNSSGKWERMYRFTDEAVFFTGAVSPYGLPISVTIPRSSPLFDVYMEMYRPHYN